jgi:hypothetical protein
MNYFLIIGCVLCGWAMLRVIGSERAQMVKDLERRLRRDAKMAALAAPGAATDSPPAKAAPAAKPKN